MENFIFSFDLCTVRLIVDGVFLFHSIKHWNLAYFAGGEILWKRTDSVELQWRRWRQLRRSGVFIVNCEHISHLFLVFLLLTLNK